MSMPCWVRPVFDSVKYCELREGHLIHCETGAPLAVQHTVSPIFSTTFCDMLFSAKAM